MNESKIYVEVRNTPIRNLVKGEIFEIKNGARFTYLGRSVNKGCLFGWFVYDQIEWSKSRYVSFFKIIDELNIFNLDGLNIYLNSKLEIFFYKKLYKKENKWKIKKLKLC